MVSLFPFGVAKRPHLTSLLLNVLFFIAMAFSIIYTNDVAYGLTKVLVMAPLIIMPISLFLITSKKAINYDKIKNYFYLSFFASTVLFFLGVLIQNYFRGFLNETIFVHYAERLNSKYGNYSMHPLYASMYVIISLLLAIPIYAMLKKGTYKFLLILSVIFLILVLLLLARKGPIIICSLIFFLYFLKFKTKKHLVYYLLIAALFFILVFILEPIRNRFLELFDVLMSAKQNHLGSTSIRLYVYECTVSAIKEAPFFGYGIGDTKDVLEMCYSNYNIPYHNSHNQFLSAWLSGGILGFVSLVLIFIQGFKIAFKSKDFVYFSILFLFLMMFLTENILERQDGVLLFSFFISFFTYKNINKG